MQKHPKLKNSAVVCGGRGGSEQLAIFGNPRARRGAELKAGSIFSAKNRSLELELGFGGIGMDWWC